MSVDTAIEMMTTYAPSIAATKKVHGTLPEGFVWYAFEWLGDKPEEWDVMKVTGSITRIAKSGQSKGRAIAVGGKDKKTVYVTRAEIKAADVTKQSPKSESASTL